MPIIYEKASLSEGGGVKLTEGEQMTLKPVRILVKKLENGEDLPLPRFMSEEASGMDIFAAVENELIIKQGGFQLVPTGIQLAIPAGYEAQLRPRSGLALKHGITLLNSPGTIDADYRGEIRALLINLGPEDYMIKRGERIAQLVIHALPAVKLIQVDDLPPSDRGEGGFGHTGHF